MHTNNSILLSATIALLLSACSGSSPNNRFRSYEKRPTPPAIKINKLDLNDSSIDLRYENRSYRHEILENIDCEIEFEQQSTLTINQDLNIKLDAFSTEILKFNDSEMINTRQINNAKNIKYSLKCQLRYNNGKEVVYKDSILHLEPGYQYRYR